MNLYYSENENKADKAQQQLSMQMFNTKVSTLPGKRVVFAPYGLMVITRNVICALNHSTQTNE